MTFKKKELKSTESRGDNPNEVERAEISKDIPQLNIKDEYFAPPSPQLRITYDDLTRYLMGNYPNNESFRASVIRIFAELSR